MGKPLLIRAHHLLCIPRFYHGGYDKRFAENIKKVCLQIRKNPNISIKVIDSKLDVLCKKCPHASHGRCNQSKRIRKWVVVQDKRIVKHLKLKPNSTYRARDIFGLSIKKANNKRIKQICRNCIYLKNCLKVGINRSFKKDLEES